MPTESARLIRERRALLDLLRQMADSFDRFTVEWGSGEDDGGGDEGDGRPES